MTGVKEKTNHCVLNIAMQWKKMNWWIFGRNVFQRDNTRIINLVKTIRAKKHGPLWIFR